MAESIGNMQNILSHLRDVKRHGDSYQARCPAHDDDKASLSLGTGDNGKILLKCHAGCSTESILSALGLKWGALFPDEGKPAKADPQISSVYDYVDENGALVFQTVRYMPKDFKQRRPDGRGAWIWNLKGVTPVPYRLPEVIRATTVFLVEGEKDADNLSSLGLTATTNPMGAKKWKPHYNQWFRSKKIAIIPDNDSTGREHAKAVASELLDVAKAVKIINLPGLKPKGDVSDWLANGGSKESLLEILRNTMPFTQVMKPGENSNSCHQQTFPLTDFGNAERFAAMHGENARYCHTWGKWLLWNGIQWTVDETAHIFQLAKETMRSVYAEAAEIRDDDRRKAVVKHARASESSGRIQAMISLAQTELKIATTGSKLDSNPWLLNVLNGTVDLRTGELRPHRRQDFHNKMCTCRVQRSREKPSVLRIP